MSHESFVTYFSPKKLIGELFVSALRHLGIEATPFEDPLSTVPVSPIGPQAVVILIASSSFEDTISAIRTFRQLEHRLRIVVVISDEINTDVTPLIEAGASACVFAADSIHRVVSAIRSVYLVDDASNGGTATKVFERLSTLTRSALKLHERCDLTFREKEVLQLLACGLSNKQISCQLSISVSTVKNHVHNILNKLQLSRRRETLLWRHPRIPATGVASSYEQKRSAR